MATGDSVSDHTKDAKNTVEREVDRHDDWLDHAVRIGLVAYGIVHLTIAWLALSLAFGEREGKPSSSGALQQLAETPVGPVLLWGVAVGMFLLVVWRLIEATFGHDDEDGAKLWAARAGSLGKAVVYGVLGFSAVKVATGGGSGGGTDTMTAQLMALPGGPVIVGAIGLGIIGYGVGQIVFAWTERFRKHLDPQGTSGKSGSAYLTFGKVGYIAKGVAIGIVGGLFGYAALTQDPEESGGLDVALQQILEQPFGSWLLGVVAIGLGCYGLFCFARARHLSR